MSEEWERSENLTPEHTNRFDDVDIQHASGK